MAFLSREYRVLAIFVVVVAILLAVGNANLDSSHALIGLSFVFGALFETGFSFAVNVLPIIVFMGSVFAVLYHLGVLQRMVDGHTINRLDELLPWSWKAQNGVKT